MSRGEWEIHSLISRVHASLAGGIESHRPARSARDSVPEFMRSDQRSHTFFVVFSVKSLHRGLCLQRAVCHGVFLSYSERIRWLGFLYIDGNSCFERLNFVIRPATVVPASVISVKDAASMAA